MNRHLFWMGFHLFFVGFLVVGFALTTDFCELGSQQGIVIALLLLAGVDLIATVFERPVIKPGPWAKSMHPGLEDD